MTMEPKKTPKRGNEPLKGDVPDVIEPPGPANKRPDVIEPPQEKKKAPLGPKEIK